MLFGYTVKKKTTTGKPDISSESSHMLPCPLAHGINEMLFLFELLQALFSGCPSKIQAVMALK